MSDKTYTKGVLKLEIVFYKFADGTSPVKDFIRSLDVKMKAKTRFVFLLCWKQSSVNEWVHQENEQNS